MDFISDNYVWFIVVGVILFMALIGYIAEKTDFGRSQFEKKVKPTPKPKKEKVKREKVKKEPKKIEKKKELEEPIKEEAINDAVVIEDEDWMLPINEPVNLDVGMNEVSDEDLTVPLGGIETVVEEDLTVPLSDATNLEEDLTVPFGEGVVEPIIEEINDPVDNISLETVEPAEIFNQIENELTPPSIEEINKNETEEDVWKF